MVIAYWAVLLRPPVLGGDTSYVFVRGTSMLPTYEAGDLVLIRKQPTYDVGDVVTFTPAGTNGHIIHRIVAKDGDRFVMRGDNRTKVDPWRPTADDINGRPMVAVPGLGLWLLAIAGSPMLTAALAGGVTFAVVLLSGPRRAAPPRRRAGGGGRRRRLGGAGRAPSPLPRR